MAISIIDWYFNIGKTPSSVDYENKRLLTRNLYGYSSLPQQA
jgi:hypothetical protein